MLGLHGFGDYRKAWRTACKAAGLTGLVPHDLRRSAARNAVRAGTPEQVVMDLGGWRTRSVFGRYNVTSEKDLADALERVSAYVADRREAVIIHSSEQFQSRYPGLPAPPSSGLSSQGHPSQTNGVSSRANPGQ